LAGKLVGVYPFPQISFGGTVLTFVRASMLKAKFGFLVLITALLFSFPASADTFPTALSVTAVTDVAQCQVPAQDHFLKFKCTPMSLDLQIAVEPYGFFDWLQITDITGTMNNAFPIVSGSGDFLEPAQNDVPGFGPNGPAFFQALGDTWIISLDQMDPDVYVMDETTGQASWITWNVTLISSTPEPTSLALLMAGLIAVTVFRKFSAPIS
jgi:hypothetical protein